MFKKKFLLRLPNLPKSDFKNKNIVFENVILNLKTNEAEKIAEAGYSINYIKSKDSYKILPIKFYTSFLLYVYLIFQDILKGKFFNKNRKAVYLFFKKNIYNKKLTVEEQTYLSNTLEKTTDNSEEKTYIGTDNGLPFEPQVRLEQFNCNKVILLASKGQGIGKSTFAENLQNVLVEQKNKMCYTDSFANNIRYDVKSLFENSDLSTEWYDNSVVYNKIKNNLHSFNKDLPDICLRDYICDYSDLMQKYLGTDYWAKSLADQMPKNSCVIIDDLRRPVELEYLKNLYGSENVISIYLNKEDSINSVPTSGTTYEGLLQPSDCDIQFTFNSDWSNDQELITTILNKLI